MRSGTELMSRTVSAGVSSSSSSMRLLLHGVDPGEGDHQDDDQQEKQQLDADGEPDQAPRLSGACAAALAVSRAGDELGAAPVAGGLDLLHGNRVYLR